MSTTNPQHGPAPAADDHGPSGPPPAETIARGHEIDAYDTTSVVSVPLLVVLFFVLAFGTVSVIFYFIFPTPDDPNSHPMALERNKQSVTERHESIPSPRQDNFRELEGHSRSITSREKPGVNSVNLHPEDIHANPINTPALFKTGWVDRGKTVARISIDDALALAAENKANKILPVAKTPEPPRASTHVPSASNAGRGAEGSQAPPPRLPGSEKETPKDKQPPEGKKSPGGKH
jgi:hypothetical protein